MEARAKILIVEDERISAEEMRRSLEYMGYAVTSIVSSGEGAVKEAESSRPDLILMDVKLKGRIDGVEAAKRIRARDDIPIIYITALSDKQTLERIKETEPLGYVHKPIEDKELYTAIEMALWRHKMERRLKESEERFRSIFEGSRDAVFIAGEDSRFVEVNEAASALTGYSKAELLKMSIPDLHEGDDLNVYNKYFKRIMKGEAVTTVAKILRKDGSKLDVEFSNKRITIGGIPFMHTVARDITERKKAEKEKERLQKQLIHSEKMAGIGTLTSGIAHEFNNLLQIIKGHTEYAKKTGKPQDIQEAFNVVISNTERARKIVKDMQAFAEQELSKMERADITEILESVLSLTAEQLVKQDVKVVKKYQRIPLLQVNRGEMEQVFLHMVTNARDAMMHKGGKLEIKTRRIKGNVEISFSDTGEGIERENLGRVFEPFYTTKGPFGKSKIPGIGLGLSVSYGIVKRHGGTIDVQSQAGVKTTFTLRFPLEREKQEGSMRMDKEKEESPDLQPMNILIVDDEEEICRTMTKWLSLEGHNVEYLLTRNKTINIAKEKSFDLIFLDVVMPGIPTSEILEKLKQASPHSDIIIMTGKLVDKDLINRLKDMGASGILQKPFKLDNLLKFIKA